MWADCNMTWKLYCPRLSRFPRLATSRLSTGCLFVSQLRVRVDFYLMTEIQDLDNHQQIINCSVDRGQYTDKKKTNKKMEICSCDFPFSAFIYVDLIDGVCGLTFLNQSYSWNFCTKKCVNFLRIAPHFIVDYINSLHLYGRTDRW